MSHGTTPIIVTSLAPETTYVTDTGPLLCLGASKELRDIYRARCYGKTHWVEAVKAELFHHSRGNGPRARAAEMYNGRGVAWLSAVIAFSAADDNDLAPIRNRLTTLGVAKANRQGRTPPTDPRANLGEAQSILHAHRHQHTLLAHDDDARIVAKQNSVPAATLVDLARRLVSEGISAKQLANMFLTLQRDGIDAGEYITGPLDLVPRGRSNP